MSGLIEIMDLEKIEVLKAKITRIIAHIVIPVFPEKIGLASYTSEEKLQILIDKVRNTLLVDLLGEPFEVGDKIIKPEVYVKTDPRLCVILQKYYYFEYLIDILDRLYELEYTIEHENNIDTIKIHLRSPNSITSFLSEMVGSRCIIFCLNDGTYIYNAIPDCEADKLISTSYDVNTKDVAFELLKTADIDELLILDFMSFKDSITEVVGDFCSE